MLLSSPTNLSVCIQYVWLSRCCLLHHRRHITMIALVPDENLLTFRVLCCLPFFNSSVCMCVHSQSVLPCSQIGVYYCRLPVYSVDVIFFVFGCVLLFSLDHSDLGLACTGLHLIHIYLFTGSSSSPFPALRPSGGRKPTNQPTNQLELSSVNSAGKRQYAIPNLHRYC